MENKSQEVAGNKARYIFIPLMHIVYRALPRPGFPGYTKKIFLETNIYSFLRENVANLSIDRLFREEVGKEAFTCGLPGMEARSRMIVDAMGTWEVFTRSLFVRLVKPEDFLGTGKAVPRLW